jgi:hypothetical protein
MRQYFRVYIFVTTLFMVLTSSFTYPMKRKRIENPEERLGELIEKEIAQGEQEYAIRKLLEGGTRLDIAALQYMTGRSPKPRTLDLFFELGSTIDYSMINALILLGLSLFLSPKKDKGVLTFIRWLVHHGYSLVSPYGPRLPEEIERAHLYYALTQVSDVTSRLLAQDLVPQAKRIPFAPEEEITVKTLIYALIQNTEETTKKIFSELFEEIHNKASTKGGQTLINDALIIAAARGFPDMVSTILSIYKDTIKEGTIQRAFINAALSNNVAIASFLLANSEVKSSDEDMQISWTLAFANALVIAAANGNAEIVNFILGEGVGATLLSKYFATTNPYIQSALVGASRWGHFTIAAQILNFIVAHGVTAGATIWSETIAQTLKFAALQGFKDNLVFFNSALRQAFESGWHVDLQKVLDGISIFLKNPLLPSNQRKGLHDARSTIEGIEKTAAKFVPLMPSQEIASYLASTVSPQIISAILTFLLGTHLQKPST